MTAGRRRVWVVAGVAVVAALAVAAVLAFVVGDDSAESGGDGPLYASERDTAGLSVRTGKALTWGMPVYYNRGKRPLTLVSARPVPVPDGVRVDAVRVAGVDRELQAVAADRSFPPEIEVGGTLQPVKGAIVPPVSTPEGEGGVELLFGLTATRPGRFVIESVEVTYRDGDREYTERLPDAFAICSIPAPRNEIVDCAYPGKAVGKVG